MARRSRRTPLEKCQDELNEIRASINQYEDCLATLREKEKELQNQVLMEKFKEINNLLEVQNMSMDDLKDLLIAEGNSEQIA